MSKPKKKQEKEKKPKGVSLAGLLWVRLLEYKPHPDPGLEQMRPFTRGLQYNRPVVCAACGKKTRRMWTMFCEFKAMDFEHSQFAAQFYPATFPPLTPVCEDHPIGPAIEKAKA